MDRRQFLKTAMYMPIGALLASPLIASTGCLDDLNKLFPKMETKEIIRIADSHAHFRKVKSKDSMAWLIRTALNLVSWQAITGYHLVSKIDTDQMNNKRMEYEMFREIIQQFIKSNGYKNDFLITFSDEYATVVKNKRNDAETIFYKSQEVESYSPYSKEHSIHLVVEGMENLSKEQDAFKVIECAQRQDATIILAHPFAVETSAPKFFRYPFEKETATLYEICKGAGIFVETFNSNNIMLVPYLLDMHKANPLAERLAEECNKKPIADTDSHPSVTNLQCAQIGLAGIENLPIPDYDSMTGKEIIQWKRDYLLNNNYELKKGEMPWDTFLFVMLLKKTVL